jgi:hypothetical protein
MNSDELDDIHSSSLAFYKKKVIGPFYQPLQVLTGRWDDLFSCWIPCLFGDTEIEPDVDPSSVEGEVDLKSCIRV